jgi:chaperonin GroES
MSTPKKKTTKTPKEKRSQALAKAKKAKAKKKKTLVPLGDNIVVEKLRQKQQEKKTKGGLFMPASARKPPNTTEVIAVAKGVKDVKVGDLVVIGTFSGTDVVVDDKDYLIVDIDQVLGVYK